MSESPLADVVSRQYEKYSYPLPIEDLSAVDPGVWYWFDPSEFHDVLWPGRGYRPDIDILIAGCGTNQAAAIAHRNPGAKVVGVDISQSSLDHEQYLKERHGLWNLQLHRLPIEELPSLGLDFDLIVSTGVLHHTADPKVSMRALAGCLRRDGVIGLALYARYGRIGVEIMQSIFRDMGLPQDDVSVRIVQQTIGLLPDDHPLRTYLKVEGDWELQYDAAIVDTFLHGRDRSYTVGDCLDLVGSADLAFAGWLLNSPYHPHDEFGSGGAVRAALQALPREKLWSVMERLHVMAACHFFMACRPDRPEASYRIDFSTPDSLGYVPAMRARCGLSGAEIYRARWRKTLNPAQLPFLQNVDGRRTIREIAAAVAQDVGPRAVLADVEDFARRLFESLWLEDFLAMSPPGAVNPG